MHLAYVDDACSHSASRIVIAGACLIEDKQFLEIEAAASIAIAHLIPKDRQPKFKRFHAAEMWSADRKSVFAGLDISECRRTMAFLLNQVERLKFPVIYSAVDKQRLREAAISSDPLNAVFRMCALGIEFWLRENGYHKSFALLICDKGDKSVMEMFEQSFRDLRKPYRPPHNTWGRLQHIHDDLYFGSSISSIGLQIADLCAWVIQRKLRGNADIEEHFQIIRPHVVCAKVNPDWSNGKGIYVELNQ
jgi:hypothetical protein